MMKFNLIFANYPTNVKTKVRWKLKKFQSFASSVFKKDKAVNTRVDNNSANVAIQETNDLLRKFTDLESKGIKDSDDQDWTHDERTAVKTAEGTRVFEDDGYDIGIAWKKEEPKFKNNFKMAYSRLENLEKSLINKGPKVSTRYNNVIENYVDKNYIRKVPLKDEEQWLLPHFPVIKEDRATTKVRIVYDAGAKDKGKSLNDAL